MKRIALILLLLPFLANGQVNLVTNGSFEDTSACPTYLDQVTTACAYWNRYTIGSSDYFHPCSPHWHSSVPQNSFGYQNAAHGNAYCGFISYLNTSTYREYISTGLNDPLEIGRTYIFSMSVNVGSISVFATDNIGVLFFDKGPQSIATNNVLSYQPQIDFKKYGTFTDSTNWVRVVDTFVADSAYETMIIGGFFPANNMIADTQSWINYKVTAGYAYYFVDSVVLERFYSLNMTFNENELCSGDTITIGYKSYNTLNTNNVLTIQLSSSNGSFASPVNIGSMATYADSGGVTGVIPSNVSPGGNYRLRLVASSAKDTSNISEQPIDIGNLNTASVSVSSNSPLCHNDNLSLSASVNAQNVSYHWTGPANFNSTQKNPVLGNVTPAISGNFFSVIKFAGCTVKDTLAVAVYPYPDTPTVSNNTPFCEPDTLLISATTTTDGVTYSWTGPNNFGSADSTIVIPVSQYTMTGVYTVKVTKNGCSTSDTTNVVVKQFPDTVTLSSNSPICEGDTLYLNSDTSTTGAAYLWTGPQSFSDTSINITEPNTAPNMTGWYTMKVDLDGCVYIDSTQVNIYSVPAAPAVTFDTAICIGETLNLSATSLSGANYSWTGPNNFNSTQQNPVRTNVTVNMTGTYTVVADNNNCPSPSTSINITINPHPFVVALSNKDSICDGETVSYTSLANNAGGTPSYQWYVNAQLVGTGAGYSTSALKHNDIVRVDMMEYTKCKQPFPDKSNDIRMTVFPWLSPSVSIVSDKTGLVKPYEYITFTATTVDAGNKPLYQWKRNGADVIGAQGSTWSANTLDDNDSISVEIVSSYQCPQPTTALSNGIRVKILSTVGEIEGLKSLTLYPNPNNGQFVLEGTVGGSGEYVIDIVNSIGQLIHHDNLSVTKGQLRHNINLRQLSSGIYILKLTDDTGSNTIIRFRVEQ